MRREDIVRLQDTRGDCFLGPAAAFDRRFRLAERKYPERLATRLNAFRGRTEAMAKLRRLSTRLYGGRTTERASDEAVLAALRRGLSSGRLVMVCGQSVAPATAGSGQSLAASLSELSHLAVTVPTTAAPTTGPAVQRTPPVPAAPVSSWTLEQRIEKVLRLTQDKLPSAMKAEFAELISPEAIAITIGIIVVWAASHGTPVGPAVDIVLLLIGIVALGWGVFEAASALYDFIAAIIGARTERDLDRAAQHLARAIALLGVAAFAALLRKIGRLGRPRSKGGSTATAKPDARPSEAPAAIEVGRTPRPGRRRSDAPERKPAPAAGPNRTTPTGTVGGKPTGTVSKIDPRSSAQKQRKIRRENESAETLADAGYKVKQNPGVQPNGKDPDYEIEGKIFDNLAPDSDNIEQVRKGISKKVKSEQTQRIVLNLDDTKVTPDDVSNILSRKPKEGLQEVIGIKDGNIYNIFP